MLGSTRARVWAAVPLTDHERERDGRLVLHATDLLQQLYEHEHHIGVHAAPPIRASAAVWVQAARDRDGALRPHLAAPTKPEE